MKLKRFLLLLLATLLLASLFSCNNEVENSKSEPAECEYTLNVRTEGGMPIANHTLKVYADSSATDLESAGSTDENGVFHDTSQMDYSIYCMNPRHRVPIHIDIDAIQTVIINGDTVYQK